MDAEIHGAIIGGIAGGATAVVGVILAEGLQRSAQRRAQFGDMLLQLTRLLPQVVVQASEVWRGPIPSTWHRDHATAQTLMLEMTGSCRGFRGAKACRAHLRHALANFIVLFDVFIATGRRLNQRDVEATRLDDLARAAGHGLPSGEHIEDLIRGAASAAGVTWPPAVMIDNESDGN